MSIAFHIPPHRLLDNFLPSEARDALLRWTLENEGAFAPARLSGDLVDPEVRLALVSRNLGPFESDIRQRIAALVDDTIHVLRMTSFRPDNIELELVAHTDGAHFSIHADTYSGDAGRNRRSDRMLSGVFYFHSEPKAFSGGALRLYAFGAESGSEECIDIEPLLNRLVLFPSWAPHEVCRVHCPSHRFADSRFAVNCWVRRARSN